MNGPEEKEEEDRGIIGVDEDLETGELLEEENEPGFGNDFDWQGATRTIPGGAKLRLDSGA